MRSMRSYPARFGAGDGQTACVRSASAKASARVALVVTSPRSTPRWTMVCAICGRMPLMMQSAPIRRAAATVFSRCCATSVSTVGTPVMSMMAISEPVSTMRCSSDLHHDLGARAVERADQRQRQDAVPQLHDRRRQLEHLLLLAADDLLAALLERLDGVQAELVEQLGDRPGRVGQRGCVGCRRPRRRANSGCLSEKTNVAVSLGLKPWMARDRETPSRNSRTGRHGSPPASLPAAAAGAISFSSSVPCSFSSDSPMR